MFYTYMHTRADDGQVFYIGKGKDRRAWDAYKRSSWWNKVVKKHGIRVQVLAEWDDEESAFEHERLLISIFREKGAPLVNMTDGGQGASGAVRSKAFRERISQVHKGKQVSDETRRRLSKAHKGRALTEEHKEKLRQINVGKKMSADAIERTRLAHLGSKRSQETRDRISQAKKGTVVSKETRQKMSEVHRARHALRKEKLNG